MAPLDAPCEDFTFEEIKQESPHQQWKNGISVKLPQKGDITNCNNWRGITLLSVPIKLFCGILMERLKSIYESLREELASFRPKRSLIDQIYTPTAIIEESLKYQSTLIVNLTDFQKAF